MDKLVSLCIAIVFGFSSFSQITDTVVTINSTTDFGDAMIANAGLSQTNMGNLDFMNVHHDGRYQTAITYRSLLSFDLQNIPVDAIVIEAKLVLTPKSINTNYSFDYIVEKVISPWDEGNVTWNSGLESVGADRVLVDNGYIVNNTIHEVNVSKHVQEMVNFPSRNNGWELSLDNESELPQGTEFGISYYSYETAVATNRPRLEISYVLPPKITLTDLQHCNAGNGPGDGSISFSLTGGTGEFKLLKVYKVGEVAGGGTKNVYTTMMSVGMVPPSSNNNQTLGNLEPGLYLATVYDKILYSGSSNVSNGWWKLRSDLYFVIGKPGIVTSCLIADWNRINQVPIRKSMGPYQGGDWENMNWVNTKQLGALDTGTDSYGSSTSPNCQGASMVDLNMYFDPAISYIKPEIIFDGYSSSYQKETSPNALEFNLIKESWNQSIVTWNSRPAIDDTQPNITLPGSSNLNGWTSAKTDTLDISSFIDYWKKPENENNGFEIVLASGYSSNPTLAINRYNSVRQYKSRFRFSFTIPEPIISEFNDSTGLGSITVNAPVGDLPYTYLIGYDSIPELSEIWNGIKDSVAIDSATFFGGKVDNLSQTFPNLKNGDYYVATFDNLGTKIFEEKITVKPNFEYFNTTNIEVSEEGVISQIVTTSAASATLIASLKSNNDGGVRFKIKNIGSGIVGFNKLGDQQINALQDLEFGIEILPNGSARIYQNNVSLGTFSIAVDDRIGIYKKEKKFYIEKNEENVFESTEDDNIEEDYSLGIYMTSSQNSERLELEMELLEGLMNQILIPINETGTIFCGDFESVISIPTNFQGWNVSATVTDLLTGQIIPILSSGNQSSISIPLPVGTYSISIVLSDPNTSATVNAGVQHINVGYNILWDLPSSINHTVTSGLELKSDPFNSSGESISVNSLPGLESGFVSFKVHLYHRPFEAPPKGNSLSPITSASISMYDQGSPLNELVKVEVQGLGYNLLSRFLMITYTNGSLITDTYLTDNDNSTYKIIYDASLSNMKVFENATQKLNLPLSGITNLKVKGRTSPYSGIYNTKVSFCQNYLFNYADLTKKLDGGYYKAKEGMVKFIFNEEYNDLDNNLTYQIFDDLNQEVITNADISKSVGYGDNRYELDFKCSGSNALSNGFYVLKVTNEKNESWFLRIKITDNC